jgi:hypothetical protein
MPCLARCLDSLRLLDGALAKSVHKGIKSLGLQAACLDHVYGKSFGQPLSSSYTRGWWPVPCTGCWVCMVPLADVLFRFLACSQPAKAWHGMASLPACGLRPVIWLRNVGALQPAKTAEELELEQLQAELAM